MHPEIYQIKPTLLDYSTGRIVYIGCIFKCFTPPRQRIGLLRRAKHVFVLLKFIVSEYDSFRFSLSSSASFWTVFIEPGAAPDLWYTQKLSKQSCFVPNSEIFVGILIF